MVVGEWLGLLAPVAPSSAVLAVGVEEGDFPEDSWDLVKVTDLFWSPCARGGNARASSNLFSISSSFSRCAIFLCHTYIRTFINRFVPGLNAPASG